MDQWVEGQPVNGNVNGSIPSLDCGPGPWLEPGEMQPVNVPLTHCCFSLSLSPSLLLSLEMNE